MAGAKVNLRVWPAGEGHPRELEVSFGLATPETVLGWRRND
jgi:hypothetical protein